MTQFQDDWGRDTGQRREARQHGRPDPLQWHPVIEPPRATGEPGCRRGGSKWLPRLVAVVLVVGAVILGIVFHNSIILLLSMMRRIGPGHDTGDQTVGLIVFSICLVSILAAMKIALQCCDREHR